MPEGKCRFWLFLVLCLVLFWTGHGEGKTLPTIVLLSPQEDVYFFPFLEIFLRRILPEYEVVTLSPENAFPPCEEYIVVGFPETLKRLRPSKEKVYSILLGEDDGTSSFLLGQIVFSWEDTALAIGKRLCANKKMDILCIGEHDHPLFVLLAELCKGKYSDESTFAGRVICVDRVSRARPFLKERKGSSFLVIFEAATEALFALQDGKIDGVVDTKPSKVAQCVAEIIRGKRKRCVIVPLFVTQENISCADAYEVVRRCLSCH